MNNWGIRQHIIALTLLPVLIVAIVLTIYFTLSQLSYITDSQNRYGNIIAQQLASVSEYAVFSGNINSLHSILKKTLSDDDIIGIEISDEYSEILIAVNDSEHLQSHISIWHQLSPKESITFNAAIEMQTLDINLPETDIEPTNTNIIGHVKITLTSTNVNAKKLQAIAKGSLITLSILFISMMLAVRLSKKISRPVQNLTNAVKKISSGYYETRINEQAPGDLGTLESGINIMAKKLQSSHEDLEAKIDESTRELQETMEELEIRNAELDIARSNAIQASKAKTEFLANMSHELRTPLGGIIGFSELLESSNLEPQQRDYSEIIKKSADNLLHIIDDVLDLSKIESGKLEINFVEFNVIDIIEEVIDLLIPIAYEKNIELFYYIDNKTPHLINSDPTRIRQILINLIGNAIKFTEKGSVSLHVSSEKNTEALSNIVFSVSDTGIGMNQLQQDRLFEAFTQADKTIERKFGGTGLGLVISKKLAQLIQGDIDFQSQHNKGSTFALKISAKSTQQKHVPNPALLNKKICFIDPQCACEKGIQSMLETWGFDTSCFNKFPDDLSTYDLLIISVCRSDIHKKSIKSLLPLHKNAPPILAIISTRSHKDLTDIKDYGFDDAVFRSSKQSYIYQSISELINPDSSQPGTDTYSEKSLFDWSNLNVLVVDDNDINLKLAEIILEKNGAKVTTAQNGKYGAEQANLQHFDLIFMDLQMPEMDGYESSELIRRSSKNDNTIIIALTANAMATKESNRFKQCGINDVLIKPFNEAGMQNTIDQWILKNNTHKPIEQTGNKISFFSKTEALELAAGNIQLANELTTMLITELPEHLQIIKNALSKNDIETLRLQTHKLHGATRCCGTLALRNAAEQLESDIDNNILDTLASTTHHLTNEIERLINTSQSELML